MATLRKEDVLYFLLESVEKSFEFCVLSVVQIMGSH